MTGRKTWELDFQSLDEARRARASIAVRVSKANKALEAAGSPGWVVHRFVIPRSASGPVVAELTFWWVPSFDEEPVAEFPGDVLDLFARRTHMSPVDKAREQEALQVPAYGPEYQARLVEILCPTQYGEPAEVLSSPAFDHWRGWKPDECGPCASEREHGHGPVDLGTDQ